MPMAADCRRGAEECVCVYVSEGIEFARRNESRAEGGRFRRAAGRLDPKVARGCGPPNYCGGGVCGREGRV